MHTSPSSRDQRASAIPTKIAAAAQKRVWTLWMEITWSTAKSSFAQHTQHSHKHSAQHINIRATLRTAFIDLADIRSLYIHIVRYLVRRIVLLWYILSIHTTLRVAATAAAAAAVVVVVVGFFSLCFSTSARIETIWFFSLFISFQCVDLVLSLFLYFTFRYESISFVLQIKLIFR